MFCWLSSHIACTCTLTKALSLSTLKEKYTMQRIVSRYYKLLVALCDFALLQIGCIETKQSKKAKQSKAKHSKAKGKKFARDYKKLVYLHESSVAVEAELFTS